MAYVDIDTFKSWIGDTLNANDDLYDTALEAAGSRIDEICKRSFTAPSDTSSARYYRPVSAWQIYVDDFDGGAAWTLAVDLNDDGSYETTIATANVELGPPNAATRGFPQWELRAVGRSTYFPISGRRRSVSLTAHWGYPGGPPSAVQEANLILARDYVFSRDAKWGIVQDPEAFGSPFRIRDNTTAQNLLRPYRRIGGWS